jgi:hypothetical protein
VMLQLPLPVSSPYWSPLEVYVAAVHRPAD